MRLTQIKSDTGSDEVLIHADMSDPNVDMDLTSDPWNIPPELASEILGRDVLRRGRIAPDGGRRPLGVTNPDSDDLVDAWGIDFKGLSGVRYSDVYLAARYTAAVGSLQKLTSPYAWPEAMIGGYIYRSSDGRVSAAETARKITGISTTAETDDTLEWAPDMSGAWVGFDKFNILYNSEYDKRGIWVTNGRKFWLLHDATWGLYLDLGSDDYLGERWDCCRISTNLVMFVSEKYPSRIVHLSDGTISGASGNESLAGLITPKKPEEIETAGDDDGNTEKSWIMTAVAGGSLSAGDYRVLLRAVNLDDSAESRFVPAYDAGDLDDRDITAALNNLLKVNTPLRQTHYPPPLHERWTHLEVWRTQAGGAAYFLERRIEIADLDNESAGGAVLDCLVEQSPPAQNACTMSDANLAGQTQASATDLLAGYPPPICRKVETLGDVTICAGKANASRTNPIAYNRMYYIDPADAATYTHLTRKLADATNPWTNYTWQDGDEFYIISCDQAVTGAYPISARDNAGQLELEAPGPGENLTAVYGYIQRPYELDWPFIESDEHIHYSRTDTFAPESFLTRTLTISNTGDKLRDIVRVGPYVAVIMSEGIHLLYVDSGELLCDTVSAAGDGTPWEHSVVVFENNVVWATPTGPRLMVVSNAADDRGHRGVIGQLDQDGRMRQWFEAAYAAGETIDVGLDTLNGAIRFRRTIDANTFQVLQYSYRTNHWTKLDDDNGVAYARSSYAGDDEEEAAVIYSVTAEGNVFEVNYQGIEHPYDDYNVEDTTLGGGWTSTTTKIEKLAQFHASMIGDMVRFTSVANEAVDGAGRVIRNADNDKIEFDALPAAASGFIIGATRFRMRFAPYQGAFRENVKTIEAVGVRALPGPRNTENEDWPDPPEGALTVRAYRNHDDEAASEDEDGIAIWDDDDVAYTSKDAASNVECQGQAITLEIECLHARTDFRLKGVEMRIRESGHNAEDVSTDE